MYCIIILIKSNNDKIFNKNKVAFCPLINMKTIFMNTENSKTSEPHKSVLNLSQRLKLRGSNKHISLQYLSIYYTWKSIRKQYKNILRINSK